MSNRRGKTTVDVESLVNSLKKHKNFRHMAKYSMSCLVQACTPPALGWDANVKAAVELGAIPAIAEIVRKHSGNEEMLALATKALDGITQESAKNADSVVSTGALSCVVKAMTEASDLSEETLTSTMQLVETVAKKNPSAMIDHNLLESTMELLKTHSSNSIISAGCARTLEKLSKIPAGAAQLIEKDGATQLLALCDVGGGNAGHVESCLKILERLARKPECVEKLKKGDGIARIVSILETQHDNSSATRAGGRLLSKLAAGELENVLKDIRAGNIPQNKLQVTVGLLSNLALNEDHADAIVAGGGVKVLVDRFNNLMGASKFSTIRAFGRLATSPPNIEVLVKGGVIRCLVNTLKADMTNREVFSAVTPSLAKLCNSPNNIERVDELGGIEAVVKCMAANTNNLPHSLSALKLIERLACFRYDMGEVCKHGGVKATVRALKNNMDNVPLCIAGLRCLCYMADRLEHVDQIVEAGAFKLVNKILAKHMSDKGAVNASVYLLTSLCVVGEHRKHVTMDTGLKPVVRAVQFHSRELAILESAQELIGEVITPEEVEAVLRETKLAYSILNKQPTKENAERLNQCVSTIGAIALATDNIGIIAEHGGLTVMKDILEDVTMALKLPEQEALLCSCTRVIHSVGLAGAVDEDLKKKLQDIDLVSAVIQSIKIHPKLPKHCANASRALETFASLHPNPQQYLSDGVVEAIVTALRSNLNDATIVRSCGSVLGHISLDSKCAVDIAKRGGTRQIIKILSVNASDPRKTMKEAVNVMMMVGCVVAQIPEGAEVLAKQGAVDCISSVISQPGVDKDVMNMASEMMARLVTKEDADNVVDELLGKFDKKTFRLNAKMVQDVSQIFQKVGCLAISSEIAEEIVEKKGDEALIMAVGKLMDTGEEASQSLLADAIRSLGHLAKHTKLKVGAEAVPVLVRIMNDDENMRTECMQSMHSLCEDVNTATAVVEHGGVQLLIDAVRTNPEDTTNCVAAFRSMRRLASEETLYKGVAEKGALQLALDQLDDSDDSNAVHVAEIAGMVNSFCNYEDEIDLCVEHEAIGTCLRSVRRFCNNGAPEQIQLFRKTVKLASKILVTKKIDPEIAVNDFGRMLASCTGPFMENERLILDIAETGEALLKRFLDDEGQLKDVTDEKLKKTILQFATTAMDNHGTNSEIMDKCAHLLSLCGGQEHTMNLLMTQLNDILPIAEAEDVTPETLTQLGEIVKKLSNMLAVDDMITDDNCHDLLEAVMTASKVLSKNSDDMKDSSAMCAAMQGMSRLTAHPTMTDDAKKSAFDLFASEIQNEEDIDSELMEAALFCMSAAVQNKPDKLKAMIINEKLMATMSDILQDTECRNNELGKELMTKVMGSLRDSPNEMLGVLDSNVLISLVSITQLVDEAEAIECVHGLATADGGEDLLWEALGQTSDSGDMQMASTITKVLNSVHEAETIESVNTGGQSHVATLKPQQMNACLPSVMASIGKARSATGMKSSEASTKLKEAAKLLAGALPMFLRIDVQDDDSLKKLVASGAIQEMLGLLNSSIAVLSGGDMVDITEVKAAHENVDNAIACIQCIHHVMTGGHIESMKVVKETIVNEKLAHCMKGVLRYSFMTNEKKLLKGGLRSIILMTDKIGVKESGITRDHLKIINPIRDLLAGDPSRQELASLATDCIDKLSMVYTDEPAKILGEKVENVVEVLAGAEDFETQINQDGAICYVNTKTGETTLNRPAVLTNLNNQLEEIVTLTTKNEDCTITLTTQNAQCFAQALKSHAKDPETCTTIAKALRKMVRDGESTRIMVENGGIESIIAAVKANPHNKTMVKMLIALLERFSRNDLFKEMIGSSGAIPLVVDAGIHAYIDDEDLVRLCLSTLANLAFNSTANIGRIMEANGVKGVERAMQEYPESGRLLENSMCLLSNLMFASDDNKLNIGQTTGDEITHVIRVHPEDINLFKMALRALGNLSFCDENIRFVVEEGATECIVKGMRINSEDDEALRLSLEVIGNFASLEEEELEDQHSTAFIIHQQGGTKEIINVCQNNLQETSLLKAGMDALSNIANTDSVLKLMVDEGIVNLIVEVLKAHDWDEELVEHTIPVLATMTYIPESVAQLVDLDGVQVITSVMESHNDHNEVLLAAQSSLTNLASVEETRHVMKEQGTLETILTNLRDNISNTAFTMEVFNTLTRMCVDEELSMAIAEHGMSSLIGAMRRNTANPDFLAHTFILIGHLAFVEENLKNIIQSDGITLIIDAITEHPDSRELMVRSIQTLDNIAMASKEYANIVIENDGKALIKEIMEAYDDDDEIQHHGNSALLSMTALESLSQTEKMMEKSKKRKALQIFEAASAAVDPLDEFRALLKAGVDLKRWHKSFKGYNKEINMVISSSWKEFMIDGEVLAIRDLNRFGLGSTGFPKKKFSSKKAIPGSSLIVYTNSQSIFEGALMLEFCSESERGRWLNAFEKLKEVYHEDPAKLAPPA
eukprot:TRINITY_DN1382_c0_g4_i1.p1 TRINITY_DN1382_c0_g4~~TRINITY_DN1382_c0_g4_i1.p1  ORF type:complete len:2462 (-),score=857.02 TRINITY_DN1382_c0_g4_i1:404-7789(-)